MLTLSADSEVGGERKTTAWGAVTSVRQTGLGKLGVVGGQGKAGRAHLREGEHAC